MGALSVVLTLKWHKARWKYCRHNGGIFTTVEGQRKGHTPATASKATFQKQSVKNNDTEQTICNSAGPRGEGEINLESRGLSGLLKNVHRGCHVFGTSLTLAFEVPGMF